MNPYAKQHTTGNGSEDLILKNGDGQATRVNIVITNSLVDQ